VQLPVTLPLHLVQVVQVVLHQAVQEQQELVVLVVH
jgi:hypothetical protein